MDSYPLISPDQEMPHEMPRNEDAGSTIDVDQKATRPSNPPASKMQGKAMLLACGAAAAVFLLFCLNQSDDSERVATGNSQLHTNKQQEKANSKIHLLDLFDLNEHAPCGRHKCFYRAKEDANLGYLVAKRTPLEELERGWNFGNCLATTYGAKHFMNDAPFETRVSQKTASTLNSIAFSFTPEIEPPSFAREKVVVQEVVVAPPSHILLGCNKRKRNLETLPYFDDFTQNVDNTAAFLETFDSSVRSMFELLRAEPALMHDFQVILDTKGEIYYLDFTNAGAGWAVNAFNTTAYRNSISSCSKMVRPIYERMGASSDTMDLLDAYLGDQMSDVQELTGRSLDGNLRRKKKKKKKNNACLPHLLS